MNEADCLQGKVTCQTLCQARPRPAAPVPRQCGPSVMPTISFFCALDVVVEYIVPVPVIGKLAERLIVKQNEREAETLLAKPKALMEA